MNTTLALNDALPIDLQIRGESSDFSKHQWVCVRFLNEEEIVELLCHRMDKSEAEVRQVLESYDRASSIP